MTGEFRESFEGKSLKDSKMILPSEQQALLPEGNMSYYEQTNDLHCGPGIGGSKFEGVSNIFEVLSRRSDIPEHVKERTDDREALAAAGAPEAAFLPSTKGPDAPRGLPEALYYKIEGVEGRLGIIQLKDLPKETRLLVRREKGTKNTGEKKYVPVSFTAVRGTVEDMPKTDFATAIYGRSTDQETGEPGPDELWTIHPGPPVRPLMKEFDFTHGLSGPDDVSEGQKQEVMVLTIEDLLAQTDLAPEDYIKIAPGDLDEVLQNYEVV